MYGICGFYEYESHKPASYEVLAGRLGVLHHRGPDDSGAHFDKDLAPEILYRTKQGFPMPTSQWLRKEARIHARCSLHLGFEAARTVQSALRRKADE